MGMNTQWQGFMRFSSGSGVRIGYAFVEPYVCTAGSASGCRIAWQQMFPMGVGSASGVGYDTTSAGFYTMRFGSNGDVSATVDVSEITGVFTIRRPDWLHEISDMRREVPYEAEWGAGMDYLRFFEYPTRGVEELRAGVLALGTPLPSEFSDNSNLSRWINGPLLQNLTRQQDAGADGDYLVATYRSVDTLAGYVAGYNETRRHSPDGLNGQFGKTIQTAGIAAHAGARNLPRQGDRLTRTGTIRAYYCTGVRIDEVSQQGRIIVYAVWHATNAGIQWKGPGSVNTR